MWVLYNFRYLLRWISFCVIFFFSGSLVGLPAHTIWKYFKHLDPRNLSYQPETAVYVQPQAKTGFMAREFVPEKPSQPDTVVFTPGLPSYHDIGAQPQNV